MRMPAKARAQHGPSGKRQETEVPKTQQAVYCKVPDVLQVVDFKGTWPFLFTSGPSGIWKLRKPYFQTLLGNENITERRVEVQAKVSHSSRANPRLAFDMNTCQAVGRNRCGHLPLLVTAARIVGVHLLEPPAYRLPRVGWQGHIRETQLLLCICCSSMPMCDIRLCGL